MTLPTTRIDTLSPPSHASAAPVPGGGDSASQSPNTTCSDSSQQVLLVDFVPNNHLTHHHSHPLPYTHPHQNGGGGNGASSESSGTPGSTSAKHNHMLPASYQVPKPSPLGLPPLGPPVHVQQPMPVKLNHFNNDLSNFTLVNLSNHNEGEEEEEEGGEGHPMIPQPQHRNSLPAGNNSHQYQLSGSGGKIGGSFSSGSRYAGSTMTSHPGPGAKELHGNVKLSSSLSSSSEDSDTGFLVHSSRSHNGIRGRNKEMYRLQKHASVTQSQGSPEREGSGIPGAFQPGNRKRLKRRRSTVRRKTSDRPQSMEASDLFPICCCFGEDPRDRRSSPGSSLSSRYLRFICFIVMIIFIATFTSIMVSLQRKVDSLSLEVNKLTSAASSSRDTPSGTDPSNQVNQTILNLSMIQDLAAKQEVLNASIASLTLRFGELSEKVSNIEKQPSIEELRKDLAHLGSEMKGSIEEMQKEIDTLKKKAEDSNRPSPPVNIDKPPNIEGGIPPNNLQQSQPAPAIPNQQ